ncbi:MAG: pyridoxamine 5'-phosphate oxidase family protein [Planctomycetota bacterium]|jgi:general stress protein 26
MGKKSEALEFARKVSVASLGTVDGDVPHIRMMETAKTDDDFTVWFSTAASSNKIRQLSENPNACVVFYEGVSDLRVFGKAEIVTDRAVKDALYQDKWDVHYKNGGKDDPEYSVIKVTPEKAEYRHFEKYGFVPEDVL